MQTPHRTVAVQALRSTRFFERIAHGRPKTWAPMTLNIVGFALASPLVLSIAMIWLAHIGFDRALGYGLKYSVGFGFTHLGRIGAKAAN
jgi:hypothetical protein